MAFQEGDTNKINYTGNFQEEGQACKRNLPKYQGCSAMPGSSKLREGISYGYISKESWLSMGKGNETQQKVFSSQVMLSNFFLRGLLNRLRTEVRKEISQEAFAFPQRKPNSSFHTGAKKCPVISSAHTLGTMDGTFVLFLLIRLWETVLNELCGFLNNKLKKSQFCHFVLK